MPNTAARYTAARYAYLALLATATLTMATLLHVNRGVSQDAESTMGYANEAIGVALTLPDETWKLTDQSQGAISVLIFSPDENLTNRCTVLILPKAFLPDGLLTREAQIQAAFGDGYSRQSYDEVPFDGRDAHRLVYASQRTKTIEWGWEDGTQFVVFQLSATHDDWSDEDRLRDLNELRDSFRYTGPESEVERIVHDPSTPDEVHQRRSETQARTTREFAVVHHELSVEIEPLMNRLFAQDQLLIESLSDEVRAIKLYVSVVDVDSVEGPDGLEWSVRELSDIGNDGVKEITVTLAEPLNNGDQQQLSIVTSSNDFLGEVDQQLVAEIDIVGQVREHSSFSSHVLYYPIDEINDASATIELTVPDGYTALTGGALQSTDSSEGTTTFVYVNEQRRKRLLPFGFAVGKYISRTGYSEGGLALTVYAFAGEEALVDQRVDVLVESANLFESMMGPLPWPDVRLAHVTPIRKETGVSLPGLILISDGYFRDFSAVDLSDGNIGRVDALSLLVVADELSHQWNIYSVPLPNELGEGISTFTNMLLIESRHGADAYRRGLEFCAQAYKQSTSADRDVAIADPNVYGTTAYRGIVFCKTPVVLDLLRKEIGDEAFFAAWQLAFREFDEDSDGFEIVRDAVNVVTGEDYTWFFDQWFFQAGWPTIDIHFEQEEDRLRVTVGQGGAPASFRMTGRILIQGMNGETQEVDVSIREATQTFEIRCPFVAETIDFVASDSLLTEINPAQPSR